MTEINTNKKNLDIEVLRAYAILITFIAHVGVLNPTWSSWTTFFWLGGGVDLFFSISGFLITSLLLKDLGSEVPFRKIAISFWVRRAFRLWPAALFWSTLTLALTFAFDLSASFGPRRAMIDSWIFGTLNLQNLYIWRVGAVESPTLLWHYWSLSLEEQFYIFLPFLLLLTKHRKHLIIPAIAIALYQTVQIRPWGSLLWFIRSDALFLGVAIGLIWHYYRPTISKLVNQINRKTLVVLFTLALPLPIVLAKTSLSPYYMGFVAISSGFVVLLASANLDLTAHTGKLRTTAIYIGSRSYSIYLVHNPVLGLIREISLKSGLTELTSAPDKIAALIIALVLTMLLAEFSFKVVEAPLRNYGSKISRRIFYRQTAATAN